MSSSSFHGFFDIEPTTSNAITSPAATHQKTKTQARHTPSLVELDEYTFGRPNGGPSDAPATLPSRKEPPSASGVQTPKEIENERTPNELEMSRPPSPKRDHVVGLVQTWKDPPINKWRVLSCCLIYFGNGMNDSGMCDVLQTEVPHKS